MVLECLNCGMTITIIKDGETGKIECLHVTQDYKYVKELGGCLRPVPPNCSCKECVK